MKLPPHGESSPNLITNKKEPTLENDNKKISDIFRGDIDGFDGVELSGQ